MGTWYPPEQMHEQWKEFASKYWGLGEAVSAEKYTRVKDAWDKGFIYGHEGISNDRQNRVGTTQG